MPSSATITSSAFVDLTAGAKARAAEVQGNFDIFRGHLLPVDPNTSAATDLQYNLGDASHRWSNAYLGPTQIWGATSITGALVVGGTLTVGDKILLNKNTTTGTFIDTTSTGSVVGYVSGVQSFEMHNSGFFRKTSNMVKATWTGSNDTIGSYDFGTLSITTHGGEVLIGCYNGTFNLRGSTYTSNQISSFVRFFVDGITGPAMGIFMYEVAITAGAGGTTVIKKLNIPASSFQMYISLSSGGHTIVGNVSSGNSISAGFGYGTVFYAREL